MTFRRVLLGGLSLAAIAGTTGVAVAVVPSTPVGNDINGEGAPASQRVLSVSADVKHAFPVLTAGRSASDAAEEQKLRDQLGATSASDHGPIGTADFSLARSSVVPGTSQRAWVVPSGDQICAVLEDAVDGYGASCASLADAAAGKGWVALTPGRGSSSKAISVAVVVPAGGSAPQLKHADGTATVLRPQGGIAAVALAPAKGDRLQAGSTVISFDTLKADELQ